MLIWANNFWSPKHLLPQYNRITHTVSEYIEKNQRQIPPRSLPQEKDGYNYEIYFLECKRTSCLHAKGIFRFFSMKWTQIFSVSRRQNYRRGRLPLISPATISSGIMPKKKAIPALLFLQNTNHSLSLMASASRSMTMRGVSSHWNTMLFIWLPVTLRIPRTNWQDFLTACSGKKIFLPF